ncbi:MAG: hypothetical protein HY905_26555 [Deltaproteobacteria bacterium]|nr:hypothetical protein [Deltaproteobacteria bacterium]
MMSGLDTKQGARSGGSLPPGKVQCFISKQVVDLAETVELDFHGVRVRIHRRYVGPSSDPAPVP